jgi:XTP/dITP diphosphohydrolase
MHKFLIASNNKGKISEISALLKKLNIDSIGANQFNLLEPEETADNFAENAYIKAKFYGDKTGLIALSDDSGLCVNDLDNQPGVHSARFALNENGQKDFTTAFEKIFNDLARKKIYPEQLPSAHFICNLCLYNPHNNFYINFEGRVNGHLVYPPRGQNGFGYDPIFVMDKMSETFGEIDHFLKESISHRAMAFLNLENWLKNNYNKLIAK